VISWGIFSLAVGLGLLAVMFRLGGFWILEYLADRWYAGLGSGSFRKPWYVKRYERARARRGPRPRHW
jgi:hypothetical protein